MYSEFASDSKGEASSWIKSHTKSKASANSKSGGRLIRSDIALNREDISALVAAYFEDSQEMHELLGEKERTRRVTARINSIFETIRNYELPFVLLDGDEGVESVCRVFETINSTGTRLTTFDLAVARYFASRDLNLRDLYDDSISKNPILNGENFDVDGERVLQIIAIKNQHESDRFIEPTRGYPEITVGM